MSDLKKLIKEKKKDLKKEETKEEKIEKLGEELETLKEEEVKEVEEEPEKTETPKEVKTGLKITFEQFKEFFNSNKELDNSEIYKAFPTVSHATLRGWKSKAKLLKETPPEEGDETPTPLTQKEIEEKIAEGVREALKTERKEPSKATQVDEPINRATIKRNWFEEIV